MLHEAIASECSRTAAHALAVNVSPVHIFTDAKCTAGKRNAACFVHARRCPVPRGPLDLAIVGFSCKGNSSLNVDRFREDATQSHHAQTFHHAVAFIQSMRPRAAILENVEGVRMARGGSGPDAKEPVLQWLLDQLRGISGYTVAYKTITGHPLPTQRPRVYFILMRDDAGTCAEQVLADINSLTAQVGCMPTHHCTSFLEDSPSWWPSPTDSPETSCGASASAESEAQYSTSLSAAFKAAGQRLDPDARLPPIADRESRFALRATPWMRAQVDTYNEIVKKELRNMRPDAEPHAVADVSQTSHRGKVCVEGFVPTIATSSKLWSYKLHRLATPSELMAFNGFSDYNFSGLSWTDATALAGNGMCSTALCVVLLPILTALGFFRSANCPTAQ